MLMLLLPLAACVSNVSSGSQNTVAERMAYTIEQNAMGEFVFCLNLDCPAISPKVLAESYGPANVPAYQANAAGYNTFNVFFNLGSSRLGAKAVQKLEVMLPKLREADIIYLRGWADSIGGKNSRINRKLAHDRAKKIQNWLKSKNVRGQIKIASVPACCNQQNTRSVHISW